MLQSIFTRPVFINPQAYLIIPELMLLHKSVPYDFNSDQYVFQVITTGQIKGKLLQNGKNNDEYILHLDLNTKDGCLVLGEFYLKNSNININSFKLEQSNGLVTLYFFFEQEEYYLNIIPNNIWVNEDQSSIVEIQSNTLWNIN